MFTIVDSYGVSKGPGVRWSSIANISTLVVYDIYHKYRKVYLTLSHPTIQNPFYVDMDDLRTQYSSYTGTLQALVTSFGNNVPPTVESIPVQNPKYAHFTDLFRAGYKTELVQDNISGVASVDKLNLKIHRPVPITDMNYFHKHSLVTINGFYHLTDTDGIFAYVYDAGKSMLKSRCNQAGVLSFANIGEVTQVPITDNMIYKQNEGSLMKERTYIKLNRDLTNKTVMLVLGGYLNFISDDAFFQVGDDSFCIDFNRLYTLSRYFESLPYIDYSELGLTTTQNNPTQVDINEFFSDAVLTKYLKMKQSFFVILDSAEIFTNRINIRPSNLSGMFTAYQEPRYPLIVGNGKVAEYWKTFEDGQWSVTVNDSLLSKRIFEVLDLTDVSSVSDSRIPEQPSVNSRGYLLEIGKDH